MRRPRRGRGDDDAALVKVDGLWVRYGSFTAVRNVSFEIPRGEVFGFIGPNGAGKTSTIKVLATLQRPSAGTVTVDGMHVVRRAQEVRRRLGYIPDTFGVYQDLSVYEYLHFFAAAYRIERSRRKPLIYDLLELTDLGAKRDAQVDDLSRGMKQRLGLARVLLHDPDLLLLDEPASGLDPRARIEIRELLKELRRMGKTILISSHILHELAELCTRIGIIEAGKMVAEGPLTDIYRQLDLRRVVHVQIPGLTEDRVAALAKIAGVQSLERHSDRLSFEIREEIMTPEELLEAILEHGVRVRMFQPEAMDMETVFMKLTEGKTA